MKRIIFYIILFIIFVLAISFSLLNSQTVNIDLYFSKQSVDLMLVILASICVGVVMGVAAVSGMMLRTRHELSKTKKEVKLVEKEVANLRSLPLKDKH
jgi:putative membrane protein